MTYYCTLFPDVGMSGKFTVEFPDVSGVVTEGNDIENSLCMAKEALEGMLEWYLKCGDFIPLPVDRSDEGFFPIEVDKDIAKRILQSHIDTLQKELNELESVPFEQETIKESVMTR